LYQKIISAVDGSFHSELAAHHAVAIASSCGGQLIVLAVDTGEVKHEELSFAVERLCQHAKTYGVLARGIIRKGDVVKTILEVINEEHADLLISATRRSEYRLFARSITQKLMLEAPCSVLAVKPAGIAKRGKSMLLPIARRELATSELIMLTSNLAKSYSYKVELLHVIEHQRWYNLAWNKLYTMRHHGEENMISIANALKELGVDVEVRAVVAESSVNAIPREAAIGKHSLALMGASQRGILKQVVYGNPIEEMLSSILCDVLIWRPKL
jgi:nucleotide-binding universal stress UspA family protein